MFPLKALKEDFTLKGPLLPNFSSTKISETFSGLITSCTHIPKPPKTWNVLHNGESDLCDLANGCKDALFSLTGQMFMGCLQGRHGSHSNDFVLLNGWTNDPYTRGPFSPYISNQCSHLATSNILTLPISLNTITSVTSYTPIILSPKPPRLHMPWHLEPDAFRRITRMGMLIWCNHFEK